MVYDESLVIEATYRPERGLDFEDAGWEIDLRFTPEDSEGHWVGVTDESLSVIVGENLAHALIADRDRQARGDA